MFLTEWTGEWSPASKTAAVVSQKVPPKVTYSLKDVLWNMESSHHIKPKATSAWLKFKYHSPLVYSNIKFLHMYVEFNFKARTCLAVVECFVCGVGPFVAVVWWKLRQQTSVEQLIGEQPLPLASIVSSCYVRRYILPNAMLQGLGIET